MAAYDGEENEGMLGGRTKAAQPRGCAAIPRWFWAGLLLVALIAAVTAGGGASAEVIVRFGVGPRLSNTVVHGGTGSTVYLSGLTGEGDTMAEQAADVLAKIDGSLAEAGTTKSSLLSATIWLSDMGNFAAWNDVWDGWATELGPPPARACVEARLASPSALVEIMVVAAVP